ncbi:hypothetical protein SRABI36_03321 [Pedobacter sp. Bi36]|nr:hypothetical protein SRABI36_03321 [Pedobacter sp. Bi36]CAH0279508.1 hypothetical protein SRABI126_03724 [Pedobacter sp. Bi126]
MLSDKCFFVDGNITAFRFLQFRYIGNISPVRLEILKFFVKFNKNVKGLFG